MTSTLNKFFRQQNFIVLSMALAIITFSMIAVYINGKKEQGNAEDNFIFYAIIIVLCAGSVFTAMTAYRSILAKSKNKSIEKKLASYQLASLIRLALLEGTSLFGVAIYLYTNDLGFLLVAAICVFSFRFLKPTKEKMFADVPFSEKEVEKLKDPSYTFRNNY